MINAQIIKKLQKDSLLFNSHLHGLTHWQTVEKYGLYLAKYSKADVSVVSLFAYFHDCKRENEDYDPKHGYRGAEYAKEIRTLIPLTDDQFDSLYKACAGHTGGLNASNNTIATCWDADRLDLGRVGILPDPDLLFTDEAKRLAETGDILKIN